MTDPRTITVQATDGTTLTTLPFTLPGPLCIHAAVIEATLQVRLHEQHLRFLRQTEDTTIQVEIRHTHPPPDLTLPCPWLRPGFVDHAVLPWVRQQLPDRPIQATATIHASTRSLVLRLTDDRGSSVYFKADGAPFPSEARLLQALAPLAGDAIPPMIAADGVRGWVLREAFVGVSLEDIEDVAAWADAAAALGRLQRRLSADLSPFIGLLRDRRADRLSTAMKAMVPGQPTLHAYIEKWCAVLEASPLPCSVVHQDFVACNVLITDAGPVLFDWSDVVLGHPFLACERMLDACWSDEARKQRIIDGYLSAWTGLAPIADLRREFTACLKLRVLYEALRWTDETAGAPPSPMRTRLQRDRDSGLTMLVDWLARQA